MKTQIPNYLDLATANVELEKQKAEQRVAWGLENFAEKIFLSSSFGAQAAVLLHMVTVQQPDLPVVLIDTGYLFPETYRFIDALTERLHLNLKVFHPLLSSSWLETRHGKLWEQGEKGLQKYGELVKVEPMQRAIQELEAEAWITGIRRQQASTRKQLGVLAAQGKLIKIQPLIDWNDKDIFLYLKKFDLPYHPLWDKGYPSIGDWHSTSQQLEGMTEEETRFGGIKRECGLHDGANSEFSI